MSGVPPIRHGERGAALLAVLVLVAFLGVISAAALQKLRLSTALAINSSATDQARAFAMGLESLVALTIDDLVARSPERTTLEGGWNGASRTYPLPGGSVAHATIRDGGNGFNLNSIAEETSPGVTVRSAAGAGQFTALMRLLGVPPGPAQRITEAAVDWGDSDAAPTGDGGEDARYARAPLPYRVANRRFFDVSELRAVADVTPEVYERLRPWLCALPTSDLSPINLNTLSPDQAPLVAMLAPEALGLDRAREALAQRPAAGWSSVTEFWTLPQLADLRVPLEVQLQPQLRTRWFLLRLRVQAGTAEVFETALIDARVPPARVAARRWGESE